ncbi:MAG: hypothetical protein ACXW32_12280 [Limisphaerales bacterium]
MENLRKTARIWLLICLSFHGPCIKALQLESLLAGPERITFSLSGEVGTIYLVESSPDLKNWTQLFSGTFTNATVELFDLAPVSAGFYRARTQIEATPPINVLPAADSTRTFTTLLTEEESVAEIYLQTATPIRLRFGTNSVGSLETVAITPVTNIVNLPFSGPLLAAVLVQGSTTESIHAASLELPIPPDIDRRFIISFTAGLDGKNLALVPHLLWTNHLAIPFTRAGLFGAALATTQEIASVAARLEALAQSSSLHAFSTSDQRLVRASASALVCFPEEAAEAQTIRRELLQQLQIEDSLTASYMGFIRAQQLVGTKVDTAATYAMFTSERCKFYQNNIEPLWAKAERNCLLHTYLLQISLSMANQAAVMGLPSEGNCVRDILAQRLCAGMLNCVKEIKECCETHSQGRDRLKDLLGITRQRDLAGLQGACDGTIDAALEDAFKACSALAWTGKFRVKAKGKSVVTRTFPLGFSEDTVSTETYFLGHVFSSTETSLGSFGRFVELKIGGDFSAKNIDKRYSETISLWQ